MSDNAITTGREMRLEGTDLLRMIEYIAVDHGPDYVIAHIIPGLRKYSEIELWALAGIFMGGRHGEFAEFIAHYTGCVLRQTTYRGEDIVGFEKPTADHPNPDPVPIWEKWAEARQPIA